MSPLFSSHKVQSSYGRKRWIFLLAVLVGVAVSYRSLKELHGMVEYHDHGGAVDQFPGFEERASVVEESVHVNVEAEEGQKEEGLGEQEATSNDVPKGEGGGGTHDSEETYDDDGSSDIEESPAVTQQQDDEYHLEDDESLSEHDIGDTGDGNGSEYDEEDDAPLAEYEEEEEEESDVSQDDDTSSTVQSTLGCKDIIVKKNTDYWGDPLVWGTVNKVDSEDECCKRCAGYQPKNKGDPACNVWVYCGVENLCNVNYRQCWLKHLTHPDGAAPAAEGPMVGWTTGIMKRPRSAIVSDHRGEDRTYHIVVSAQGTATHWQSRIHYYWYKKIKKQCQEEGDCEMGEFTRLLHSGEPDDLMDEIPTFVAKELPPEHPHHGYIVLNRPYAFLQWIQKAEIKEKYILMGEPDHLWLKPMPNLMDGENPAAFPFFYIEPTIPKYLHITEKFAGKIDTEEKKARLFPIGSSPTLLSVKDMKKIVPIWYNVSLAVHEDDEAVKEWGWVQEMYAFTISMYLAGVKECGLFLDMMSQPPWDSQKDKYYILHYTYGMDYDKNGTFTPGKYGEWRFDKRSYSTKPLPRNLEPPPDGVQNDLVRHLINAFNEATEKIPGWNHYVKTGHAKKLWDGVIEE